MSRALTFLAIALAASLAVFFLYRGGFPFVEQVDLRLKDARFRMRGPLRPGPEVALVAIDNPSIKEIGRWPWSRETTAALIEKLHALGARVVALDMVFSEPQGESPDRALARAVAQAPGVVLGYFFREEGSEPSPLAQEQTAADRVKLLRLEPGVSSVPLTEFPGLEANLPEIASGARAFGFFNQIPDDDGLFRKTPLLLLYRGDIYPSLGLRALSRYLGNEVAVRVAPFGVRTLSLGGLELPVNEQGRFSLNYYGPTGSFPTVSAADVLLGRVAKDALRDKLVFIGATDAGIYDLRATPFDPALPGVEIHATLAANALDRRSLIRDGRTLGLELGCMFLLPLALALVLCRAPRTLVGLCCFGLGLAGYFALNYLLFARYSLDLSLIFPVAPLGLTYLGAEAYRNLVIERRGKHLRRAFASYVSPELVDQIVQNPDRLKLGGEMREVTILFSDIRGFTTLSEGLAPQELVRLLNSYLTPMTRIVMEERGTLDKFIGDAVMALYNAPLEVAGHAGHACRSALRMVERLKELNAEFEGEGLPRLEIGIGVNTGAAVVGNMGADIRFDYTAIGDSVNLASRLEGLNKLYGTRILVSAETRLQAGGAFHFREVDLVRVKGKLAPVAIHELLAAPWEELELFESALARYRDQEFEAALPLFERLAQQGDGVARVYLERCREFRGARPGAGWDGVFQAKSK